LINDSKAILENLRYGFFMIKVSGFVDKTSENAELRLLNSVYIPEYNIKQ